MSLTQLRQLLGNNLLHGENSRVASAPLMGMAIVPRALIQPDYARRWATDISHWDGVVRLDVTKSFGASCTYIKAIDGTIQSRYFVENRETAQGIGYPAGPYGWLYRDENVNCVKQAQAYNDLMQKYPMPLRPAIDFEPTYYGGVRKDPTYSDLRKWVTEWLRLGNPKPVLYSAAYFMNPYGTIPSDLKEMFLGLWVANYNTNNPLMPMGYAACEWLLHQFSSTGDAKLLSPNSVNKLELDLNYLKAADTLTILGGASEPPTQPTGDDMLYEIKNNSATSTRTIRRGPSVVFASIGTIPPNGTGRGRYRYTYDTVNTVLQAKAGDKWIEIDEPMRGWVAQVHNGETLLAVTETPAPPATGGAYDDTQLMAKIDALSDAAVVSLEKHNLALSRLEEIKALVSNGTPNEPPPPVSNDGYIGAHMGIYRVLDLPDMQAGNSITTIQDSYGNEVTIVMDKMAAWMATNCPGWDDFVKSGAVRHDADGFWRYEVKLIKGQLVRIAEVGGKTKDNPLGNGRIVGVDSEGDPTHGATNMDAVSVTLTPWYFHKIPNVPRQYPIIQPRQQPQMKVLNAWWVPMRWLEKVS